MPWHTRLLPSYHGTTQWKHCSWSCVPGMHCACSEPRCLYSYCPLTSYCNTYGLPELKSCALVAISTRTHREPGEVAVLKYLAAQRSSTRVQWPLQHEYRVLDQVKAI